jgi:hypothetical protein
VLWLVIQLLLLLLLLLGTDVYSVPAHLAL